MAQNLRAIREPSNGVLLRALRVLCVLRGTILLSTDFAIIFALVRWLTFDDFIRREEGALGGRTYRVETQSTHTGRSIALRVLGVLCVFKAFGVQRPGLPRNQRGLRVVKFSFRRAFFVALQWWRNVPSSPSYLDAHLVCSSSTTIAWPAQSMHERGPGRRTGEAARLYPDRHFSYSLETFSFRVAGLSTDSSGLLRPRANGVFAPRTSSGCAGRTACVNFTASRGAGG